ncbi:hypothetical protein AA979_12940 [Stenotrophomonas maltophilia]|nr:hypothetical protein AA979_12940 [Stenotrophomonas maltophilia]
MPTPKSSGSWPSLARHCRTWPALTTIVALRDKARARQGAAFDLRRFHAELLKDGSMPLDVLDRKMERWMAQPASATPAPSP